MSYFICLFRSKGFEKFIFSVMKIIVMEKRIGKFFLG